MFNCTNCPASFESEAARKAHTRKSHQMQAEVTLSDGSTVAVTRSVNGTFKCPVKACAAVYDNPNQLTNHTRNCCPAKFSVALPNRAEFSKGPILVPCGGQILVLDVLRAHHLVWNNYVKMLICTMCHVGIPFAEIKSHYSTAHKSTVNPTNVAQALLDAGITTPPTWVVRTPEEYNPLVPCRPVEGILVYEGFMCLKDGKAFPEEKSMRNHFDTHHKDLKHEWAAHVHKVHCQSLHGHKHRKYFAVKLPNTPFAAPPDFTAGDSDLASPTPAQEAARCLSHILSMDLTGLFSWKNIDVEAASTGLFIKHSGILTAVQSCLEILDEGSISALHELPSLASWQPFFSKWLQARMDRLFSVPYLLRRAALSTSSKFESTNGLSPLQESSSVSRYAATLTKLIIFTHELSASPLTNIWSPGHSSLVLKIRDLLDKGNPACDPSDSQLQLIDHIVYNFSSIQNFLHVHSSCQSLLETFVALMMYKGHGAYHPAGQLTKVIADLQYCSRVAVVFHYSSLASQSRKALPPSDANSETSHLALNSLCKAVFRPFHDDSYVSPMASLGEWKRLAFLVLANNQLPDSTYWVNSERSTLSIGSHTITINGVRTALQTACQFLGTQMLMLCNGAKLPAFTPAHLIDNPRNTSPGFSYLCGSAHNFKNSQYSLLSSWMAGNDKFGVLAPNWKENVGDSPDQLGCIWHPAAAWRWLGEADKLLDYIYFIYHVGCGQPARGTEERSIATCNLGSTPRNLFWRKSRFLIQTWYHKGQNMTNRSKPRQVYLTPQLSVHLHNYLAYIRPVQLFMLQQLGQASVVEQMQKFLFVNSQTGKWDTPHQSNVLRKLFSQFGVAGLTVAQWRQAAVSISAAHFNGLLVDPLDDADCNNFMDVQRNHTSSVANTHYGFSSGVGVSRDDETHFQLASEKWQDFWEIRGKVEVAMPINPINNLADPFKAAHKALSILTRNPRAQFVSPFQEQWLTAVFAHEQDLLVIAKTGGGKSLAYMLPPLFLPHEQTVVIQPLRALVNQTVDDLSVNHISVQRYQPGHPIDPSASVILSSRFVFTSASLPPAQANDLMAIDFSMRSLKIFRESTFRPELQIEVSSPMELLALHHHSKELISEHVKLPEDRAIIFIENRDHVDALAAQLDAFKYHSTLDEAAKDAMHRDWRCTKQAVMVATSGFGAGINYAHVRLVIIFGLPCRKDATRAYQQLGRAGRDGQPAFVSLVPTTRQMKLPDEFQEQLLNPARCAAGVFSAWEDTSPTSCGSYPTKCFPCSRCTSWQAHIQPDKRSLVLDVPCGQMSKRPRTNETQRSIRPMPSSRIGRGSCSKPSKSPPKAALAVAQPSLVDTHLPDKAFPPSIRGAPLMSRLCLCNAFSCTPQTKHAPTWPPDLFHSSDSLPRNRLFAFLKPSASHSFTEQSHTSEPTLGIVCTSIIARIFAFINPSPSHSLTEQAHTFQQTLGFFRASVFNPHASAFAFIRPSTIHSFSNINETHPG
ncbi:hypothetical protein PCANC_14252 [Puccinia coronata f. sp. avenae]|uniref:DNA 3'-5' helicase n=1 Tax=Puccinia coronata f. sp. avenae TaxID=200324 RepID=A0A2N5UQ88_9BASI|nr:hypothetical protein PCANC_14252 [Puccinia coronata f. sp. avenae]